MTVTDSPAVEQSPPESNRTCRRRKALEIAAAGLTVGLAGCVTRLPGTESKLERQLDRVRDATAQYEDPKQALRDGFQVFGPNVPGMGWHFLHPGRGEAAAENGFEIEQPNLLTYIDTDEGLVLSAVEWGAPVESVPENPDLFDDDGSETWHVHEAATHVFAVPDDEQTNPAEVPIEAWVTNDHWSEFRPPDPELQPGDTVALNWGTLEGKDGERTERIVDVVATHPDLNTLHAWVHTENPEGVFHPVNPEVNGEHSH